MLRVHPGVPRPPASVQTASLRCPGEKGQVAPAEAPIILSSPRTSKTDSYELVWRPRHEGGSRAPIFSYVVKYRKVWGLVLCPPPLRLGRSLCLLLSPLELLQPGPPVSAANRDLPSPVHFPATSQEDGCVEGRDEHLPSGLRFMHRLPRNSQHQLLVPEERERSPSYLSPIPHLPSLFCG